MSGTGLSSIRVCDVRQAWHASDPTLNGDWDGLYVEYGHTWYGAGFDGYSHAELLKLPRVSTETGWPTQGDGAITEEQQARVFLDLYLSAFRRGWSYTFVYVLRDDPIQGYWGLFNTDYTPKTSGEYLHNLTTLLADDARATPGRLDYSLTPQPKTVHDLLLQRSDGAFLLVVWGERMTGGTDPVTVDLGATVVKVRVYDPTVGTAPVTTLDDARTVDLELSDHPLVLEL